MDRKTLVKLLFIASLSVFMGACATNPSANQIKPSSEYSELVKSLTVKDELYSGFTNIFHYSASLMTQDLSYGQLDLLERAKQWSKQEKRVELIKVNESLGNETTVFLSFFTPEIRYNDLNESGSVWRVFLDVDGRRYSAIVNKHSLGNADLSTVFPDHTPWSSAYSLKFPVSFRNVKRAGQAKLVITGSLGVSQKEFKF